MPNIEVIMGDVLEKLKELPVESVHCVITSPPYWGLRDYSKCRCAIVRFGGASDAVGGQQSLDPRNEKEPDPNCSICKGTGIIEGAKDKQLGLEKTPEEYVQHLVEVFREVRRVLRDDGTCWLNLGDSYGGEKTAGRNDTERMHKSDKAQFGLKAQSGLKLQSGLKPKDLVGIPWRVAFALQADGWYLRSDIIWNKPNAMPESVRDRPTKSHEYVFLLTKSNRYFFDQEAVREHSHTPKGVSWAERKAAGATGGCLLRGANQQQGEGVSHNLGDGIGRNIRTVWAINIKPYPEGHFATFPEELPERCIKAGTSQKGCCAKCGAPYERVIEIDRTPTGMKRWDEKEIEASAKAQMDVNHNRKNISGIFDYSIGTIRTTKGWKPTCECNAGDPIPCTVLDPFAGSGTTGMVAKKLGRSTILIELNPLYIELINVRTGIGVRQGPLDQFKEKEELESGGIE